MDFEKGMMLKGKAVERMLKPTSLVPTRVSLLLMMLPASELKQSHSTEHVLKPFGTRFQLLLGVRA